MHLQGTFVECTSCHDPHNNEYGNFLPVDSRIQRDAICTVCHEKSGWSNADSAHRTGGSRPGMEPVVTTVAAAGCLNCHLAHSAPGTPYLLKSVQEENNCFLACHRQPPYADLWSEFNDMIYRHPLDLADGTHRANPVTRFEDVPVAGGDKHVECVDCHNPHQSGWENAPLGENSLAPAVNGPLRGVRGVNKSASAPVDPAQYEYEICFKCHAGAAATDSDFNSFRALTRPFETFDESLRFALANPSYHPVSEERQGTGLSLKFEYRLDMNYIYCSDCHVPHGTNLQFMLRAENNNIFPAVGLPGDYPLCFRCHDRDFLFFNNLDNGVRTLHNQHVLGPHVSGNTELAPCSACHDPHGVPASEGANANNAARLINFDTRYAGPAPLFDAGTRSCSVGGDCHVTIPPLQTY
jgi:predicted CXXCH cytochrome family protein